MFRRVLTSVGFDASAHVGPSELAPLDHADPFSFQMTEETHNAAMSGPIGIVMAIGVSAVLGWFLILGLLFSIQDLGNTVASPTGEPVAQIFLDTVGEKGAIVLMVSRMRSEVPAKAHARVRSSSSVRCSGAARSRSRRTAG